MRSVAALLLVFAVASTAVAQTPPQFVDGRVVRASNGAALARARVVVAVNGQPVATVLTDVHGRFSVTVPPDGVATLTTTKAGFAPFSIPLRRGAGLLEPPDELAMQPGAAISGRVVDAAGVPAVAARVTVVRLDGEIPGQTLPLAVETDDRGEYRVGSLPQGRYRVSAVPGSPFIPVSTPIARFRVARVIGTTVADLMRRGPGAAGLELPATVPRSVVDLEPGRSVSARDLELPSIETFPLPTLDRQPGGAIRGYVRNPTGQPAPNVQVRLTAHPDGFPSVVARTNVDGSYALLGMPAGEYRIEALKDGQDPNSLLPLQPRPPAIPIVVTDGALDVDLVLPRGGVIEGTVVDDQGDPMEGIAVAAFLITRRGDRVVSTRTGRERITDDRGRYRLFELPRGEYLITADANAESSGRDRGARVGFARVFHPSVHDIDAAVPVVLGTDTEVAGVDIEYALTTTARVTGVAHDSRGESAEGFALLAPQSRQGGVIDEPRFAPIGPDGAFVVANVPPGRYVIQVIRESGMGRTEEFGAQLVSVEETDPAPLSIRTAERSRVSGRVLIERPGRAGRLQGSMSPLTFRALPVDPEMSPSFEGGRTRSVVSSNGTFEISGLVGPSRVTPGVLRDGWYAKSFMLGPVDLLTTVFDFSAGRAFDNATLVLSPAGAVIEGRVTAPRNGPARDAIVFVFSTDRTRWEGSSQHVKAARTSQQGEFRVNGLPPGEYLVAAADADDTWIDFEEPGADFLQRLAARARRVELDEGETRTVVIR